MIRLENTCYSDAERIEVTVKLRVGVLFVRSASWADQSITIILRMSYCNVDEVEKENGLSVRKKKKKQKQIRKNNVRTKDRLWN